MAILNRNQVLKMLLLNVQFNLSIFSPSKLYAIAMAMVVGLLRYLGCLIYRDKLLYVSTC